MDYQLNAQRDKRWKNVKLGKGSYTIGSDGCVITSLGMMIGMEPPEVNQRLLAANQFSGSLVTVARIPYERVFDGRLKYITSSLWYNYPIPDPAMDVLRKHLLSGHPALVCVDSTPAMSGIQYHYMMAGDVAADGEIIVWDSWYAVIEEIHKIRPTTVSDFLKQVLARKKWWGIYGKNSAGAIYRYDLFEVKR